jgi:chromosome segregation ATPase
MRADREEWDKLRAAADKAERQFEQSRQRLLDAYSHIGLVHAKLGVIDQQLQDLEPQALSMEKALQRTQAAREIGRSLKGETDRAVHYAALTVYESMDPDNRPSLSAVQGRIGQAVHGFSISVPNPEDGE